MRLASVLLLVALLTTLPLATASGAGPTPTPTPKSTRPPALTPGRTATPTRPPAPTPTSTPTPVPEALPARVKVPILMYHYIRVNPDPSDGLGYSLSVTPEDFEAQIALLTERGYQTVHLARLVAYFKEKRPLPPQPIVITFDDGYRDFYEEAYPVLQKYRQTATVFIITGLVGEWGYLTAEQIAELAANGVEFGGHTARHRDVRWLGEAEAEATAEIEDSKQFLETILGGPSLAFSYPFGAFSARAMNLVEAAGYQAAVTTRYGLWHSAEDLLALRRVRVSGGTTAEALASLIE